MRRFIIIEEKEAICTFFFSVLLFWFPQSPTSSSNQTSNLVTVPIFKKSLLPTFHTRTSRDCRKLMKTNHWIGGRKEGEGEKNEMLHKSRKIFFQELFSLHITLLKSCGPEQREEYSTTPLCNITFVHF